MAVNTVETLQDRVIRATDDATKHDPTWINSGEVINVNLDIISVDTTDYPFPIEFWTQSGDEIAPELTQHRCYRQAKRQYDRGGMKCTKARVGAIKNKLNHRPQQSLDDMRWHLHRVTFYTEAGRIGLLALHSPPLIFC